MKKKIKKIYLQQKKRSLKSIIGTPKRPRLSIFRSHFHIYAQLIDDQNGCTLAFSSTLEKDLISLIQTNTAEETTHEVSYLIEQKLLKKNRMATQKASFFVGQNLGRKARKRKILKVVFDRGNRPYHGRIKSVAEGARNVGLFF